MLARAAFPSFFLTLAAFILLLLVTLSVPIIKTIYLLHIVSPDASVAAANLGVLGSCYHGSSASIVGIQYSGTAVCTHPKVGYELDVTFFGGENNKIEKAVIKGLAGSLVLNPIACAFAGFSLFLAFFAWFFASRIFEILCFVTLFLSSFLAWIAFWLDLALVLVARARIKDFTKGVFIGHIGNALWIGLAAACTLSVAICFTGCGVFGRYSSNYNNRNVVPTTEAEKGYGRRRFWQRGTVNNGTY